MKLWPLLMAAVISWPLNVSWSVIPSLLAWGLQGGALFLIAELLANGELFYWWWFWGWLGRSIQKLRPVQEAVELGKGKIGELKKDRYFRWRYIDPIKNHFLKKYDWLTDSDNSVMRWLKWGGHGMMFVFGVEPFIPGLRIAGTFFCRTAKWRNGFATLLIGNFFHIAMMFWGWSWLFSDGWQKFFDWWLWWAQTITN